MTARASRQVDASPTRDRILGAAEGLFARAGFDGVSIREIGTAAEAGIALIHYHFGSKEGLYRAVFERRILPLSERRRAALAAAVAGPAPPAIEAVLDALARPWIELRGTPWGRDYTRLIAREVNDPREAERGIVADLLDPIAREFMAAMGVALPGHPQADVHWAYHILIATLLSVLGNPERIGRLSGGLVTEGSDDAVIARLVGFVATALRATTTIEGGSHAARHVPGG